jgi:hypothetical protein
MSATFVSVNVCALDSWAKSAKLSTDEDARIKRIAGACKDVGADVIQVNELVTYQNAQVFAKAMGWGDSLGVDTKTGKINLKKGDSCILKGSGHVGVAQGFIWNPDVLQPYWAKEIDTYPGWDRNRYAVAMRAFLEGKRVGLGSVHLEFYPKGTNNKPRYDDIRYEQMDGFFEEVKSPNQSWLVLGDQNHAENDKPDAPGKAAFKHGLVGVGIPSFIIRAQRTKDIKVGKPRMVALGKATDKPMLVIPDVTVPR